MEEIKLHTGAVASRRQQQIEDCLFENMLHMPYAAIRVADLCRQVGISRKAFYNYYHDKDACLCAYIGRVIREAMLQITAEVPDNATPLETATVLLEYWKRKKSFWDAIIRNQLLHYVMVQSIQHIQAEDPVTMKLLSTAGMKSDLDILGCYMSVQMTLVLQWYFRDFQPGAEEMAKKLLRMTYQPFLAAEADNLP